jgi:hypothetical protein
MATRTEVFRLESFSFDNPESSVVPDLASISPYLALPSLNDNDSSDRLLTALRAGPKISRRPNDNLDRKGKSREAAVEPSSLGHAEQVEDDREFWLNVAESEPGPSKPRPNKVSVLIRLFAMALMVSQRHGTLYKTRSMTRRTQCTCRKHPYSPLRQ